MVVLTTLIVVFVLKVTVGVSFLELVANKYAA